MLNLANEPSVLMAMTNKQWIHLARFDLEWKGWLLSKTRPCVLVSTDFQGKLVKPIALSHRSNRTSWSSQQECRSSYLSQQLPSIFFSLFLRYGAKHAITAWLSAFTKENCRTDDHTKTGSRKWNLEGGCARGEQTSHDDRFTFARRNSDETNRGFRVRKTRTGFLLIYHLHFLELALVSSGVK